jgi:hypothetical protein
MDHFWTRYPKGACSPETGRGAYHGVTEQMKAEDQMLWVRKMNNIRASEEEIVRTEIIFCTDG